MGGHVVRLLVTGGRYHGHEERVVEALNTIHAATPVDTLIHGACPSTHGKPRSLDMIAAEWAARKGIPTEGYPADWDNIDAMPCRIKVNGRGKPYNALAGPNRNTRMILQGRPHLGAVFFIRGPGTTDCRSKLLKHGIPILDIDP